MLWIIVAAITLPGWALAAYLGYHLRKSNKTRSDLVDVSLKLYHDYVELRTAGDFLISAARACGMAVPPEPDETPPVDKQTMN